ncbi:hypothetical protein GCM10020220_078170 [Nonomuraea rubra]
MISSAAREKFAPAQPVCSGAFAPVWLVITADQASMIWIAFFAYRASLVRYHCRACV